MKNLNYPILKRKDDPVLFDRYLNTINRHNRKIQILWLRFVRELAKALYIDGFYKKIIRFFTTQTIPSQKLRLTKEQEKRFKQLIRLEVRKQLNKKK